MSSDRDNITEKSTLRVNVTVTSKIMTCHVNDHVNFECFRQKALNLKRLYHGSLWMKLSKFGRVTN